MSIRTALRLALGRAVGAWRPTLAVHLWNLVLAACLGTLVFGALASSFGSSLAGERMRAGFDPYWYNGFSSYATPATGAAATFRPSVTGKGAVLDALDAFFDGFLSLLFGPGGGVVPLALAYLLSWSFLSGGFIATFAGRAQRGGFLAAASRHFPSILVITALGLVCFGVMLGPVRFWLDASLAVALRETLDERVRFAWVLAEYVGLWLVICAVKLVSDYAKVAVVRHGGARGVGAVPGALWRGVRLVVGHPLRTGGLYVCTALIGLAILGGYVAIVPGTGTASTAAIVGMFLLGQVYVLSRVFLRALFYAGATVMSGALDLVPDTVPGAVQDAGPASPVA